MTLAVSEALLGQEKKGFHSNSNQFRDGRNVRDLEEANLPSSVWLRFESSVSREVHVISGRNLGFS